MVVRVWLLRIMATLYLLSLGVLSGIAAERIRFSQERGAIVARLESAVRARQATLIVLERGGAACTTLGTHRVSDDPAPAGVLSRRMAASP